MVDLSWKKQLSLKNGAHVTLRYVQETDAQLLMSYINPIVEENACILMNEVQSLEQEQSYITLCIEKMKNQQMIKMVAEHEGKIIGGSDLRRATARMDHIVTFGIALSKDFRGVGLGKALMMEILEHAKFLKGVRVVRLTCYATNTPALKLYENLNFKEYGRLPKAIRYEDQFIDQVMMYKELF